MHRKVMKDQMNIDEIIKGGVKFYQLSSHINIFIIRVRYQCLINQKLEGGHEQKEKYALFNEPYHK